MKNLSFFHHNTQYVCFVSSSSSAQFWGMCWASSTLSSQYSGQAKTQLCAPRDPQQVEPARAKN